MQCSAADDTGIGPSLLSHQGVERTVNAAEKLLLEPHVVERLESLARVGLDDQAVCTDLDLLLGRTGAASGSC